MLIWTAQKLQNTKHNSGSAFPDIITGFGFQKAVDGCSRAQRLIRLARVAILGTGHYRATLVHSQPAKALESKSGP